MILNSLPDAKSRCSEEVHASVESTQLNVLSVAPLSVIPPPSAVVSEGEATDPSSKFLSSTVIVVELIVVVVPFTVRLPETVTSVGSPNVRVPAASSYVAVTSLAVPLTNAPVTSCTASVKSVTAVEGIAMVTSAAAVSLP